VADVRGPIVGARVRLGCATELNNGLNWRPGRLPPLSLCFYFFVFFIRVISWPLGWDIFAQGLIELIAS
jgi:hypothetical protein